MSSRSDLPEKSRLSVLLEHFLTIDDPRDVRRFVHPLSEILLLVVCGTMAGCDDYDHIAAWGKPIWTSFADIYPTGTASPAATG